MLQHGLAIPDYLDTIAMISGALVGAMGATRKGLDWLGVFLVAFCTSVGGGVVRDTLLQNGVPAVLQRPSYQLYAVIGAIVGMFFAKGAARFNRVYETLDTIMIGVWVLLGCSKAQEAGLGAIAVVFVGTIAAVGGGLVRDVLVHDTPAIVQAGYWYTVAAFWAATAYVLLTFTGVPLVAAEVAALATASGLRFVSLHFRIVTPTPYDVGVRVSRFFGVRN